MNQKLLNTLKYALLLLLALSILKPLAPQLPLGNDLVAMFFLCFQLYLPLWLLRKQNANLYDYDFFSSQQKTNWKALLSDTKITLFVSLLVFVPYLVFYHFYQNYFATSHGMSLTFQLNWGENWWQLFAVNLLIVALPEEVFYRAFLQNKLLQAWPNRTFVFFMPLGRAIIATNLFFALAHFTGDFNLSRLLPFFPGLVFSALTYYSRAIWGTVLLHALCNVLSNVLNNSYTWS
ncbi:MAG: CPBP family intramembrane metalloprotease [bacterium]|nr:CPBP family intramembrane metalloprotease [bacterium]